MVTGTFLDSPRFRVRLGQSNFCRYQSAVRGRPALDRLIRPPGYPNSNVAIKVQEFIKVNLMVSAIAILHKSQASIR
jgi:hypothetical protein